MVDDVNLFITNPKVNSALRVAFANLISMLPDYVIVELRAGRRLSGRRLPPGSVTVYYRVELPPGSNAWLQAEAMNQVTTEEIKLSITSNLQRQGIMQTVSVVSHSSGSVDLYQATTTVKATLGPPPSTTTRRAVPGRTNSAGGNALTRVALLCIMFGSGARFL